MIILWYIKISTWNSNSRLKIDVSKPELLFPLLSYPFHAPSTPFSVSIKSNSIPVVVKQSHPELSLILLFLLHSSFMLPGNNGSFIFFLIFFSVPLFLKDSHNLSFYSSYCHQKITVTVKFLLNYSSSLLDGFLVFKPALIYVEI